MGLGGGLFVTQNKVLPGTYINFVSAARARATLSDRGIVAIPVSLNWGEEATVFTVTNEEFRKDSLKVFGYTYESEEVKGIRELFANAKKVYFYRLNSGGIKASNTYATALYGGTRGNDLKIVIAPNVDDSSKFDVSTMLGTKVLDIQTVSDGAGLKANAFVTFKTEATLENTSGIALTGGTNGTVDGEAEQNALNALESYSFNVLGCLSASSSVKSLYTEYTKRLRDEMGVKFQLVVYNQAADYEGVINVKNKVSDQGAEESSLVYWLSGAEADCAINKSCTNMTYEGEFTVVTNYKQSELEAAIRAGELTFHKVGDEVRVLDDINSLVSVTDEKGEDFKSNQTVRVLDQVGNDIALLFNNKYLGKIQNNKSGRVSFWSDIVAYDKELEKLQAIENFDSAEVVVELGNDKKSVMAVNPIQPVNCMTKLYMTVIVQ
ncbi:MAG TPA: phage tail protein [Lachnospiraceae bacterium]|uniref:phage tail sheath family protein n=1 Tax=Anaerosporobacter sp. TaxID=1872529 RepID=UPI000EC06749|nr:phage tail sheath family protein [Anaerosporobacter sp.]HAB60568.1 phage tail protein [Lachnospiraceae bacterium]